jgi:hypothetical protein
MKVAVLSESSADEAAVRILVDGVLGVRTEQTIFPIRARGWGAVLATIRPVLMHLYYRTDARGFVVTLDSDLTPLHRSGEEEPCRLCQIRSACAEAVRHLSPIPGREPIKHACGVAIPAVEAWYLVGRDPHVGEADWQLSVQAERFGHRRRELKRIVYGTETPSIEEETRLAVENASRLVQEGRLGQLEQLFPVGFGTLVTDLRAWNL